MGNGKWIWYGAGLGSEPEYVLFRKEIVLESVPDSLPLSISADSRYILWINGKRVSRGPVRAGGAVRYIDTVDAAPFLRPGVNVVAADVIHYVGDAQTAARFSAGPCSILATGQGGLLLYGDPRFDTDEGYDCLALEGYRFLPARIAGYLGFFEEMDGSRFPFGYREPGFRAAGWRAAQAVGDNAASTPYGVASVWRTQPRSIPFPFERDSRFAGVKRADFDGAGALLGEGAVIPPHTRVFAELDAGNYVTGFPNLRVDGGEGGRIQLLYAESYMYEQDGRRGIKGVRDDCSRPGSYLEGDADIYVAGSGLQTYTPYHYRAFRFLRLDIVTSDEPLRLQVLPITETGYPLSVDTDFQGDRPVYQDMWAISLHTLQCCMYETYMDCPHYEQMQYLMDTRLEALYTYAISRDGRLARKAILDFYYAQLPDGMMPCNSPCNFTQIIPGFALFWIDMLEDYYLYHGDLELVRACFPGVEKILLYFRRYLNEDGLLRFTGFWQFVDWTEQWDRGVPIQSEDEVNVLYCLMLTAAIRAAARLAGCIGRPDVAREYEEQAARMAAAINARCFDETDGLYVDVIGRRQKSQQAQIWAVLSGTASPERARAVMKQAVADPSLCRSSFCMQFYLCRALEKTGLYGYVEQEWTRWRDLMDYRLFTWPEDDINWRSDCHAWSATPLYEFVACGLGVRPGAPGWRTVRIAPKMLWMASCRGSVLTPYGRLQVDWRQENGLFVLKVEAENPTPVVLELPDGHIRELEIVGSETAYCPFPGRERLTDEDAPRAIVVG